MPPSSRFVVGLGFLTLGSAVSVQAQAPGLLRLEKKIELPDVQGRIDHMSVDPKSGRLFMAALGNDTVEVIDIKAAKRAETIRGLAEPQGILIVPEANRLFVANGKDGTVRIFDGSSLGPLQTVHLGDDADNVRTDPATGRIWIGYGDGALGAIDAQGTKVADVPLGAHPESFQMEKSGSRVFVNLPSARKVAVVDRNKGAVIVSWGTGGATANFPMALDEAHKRLFVVCRTPARLLVLNTDSGAIVATLPTVGDSDDVFYDQSAKRLYVSGGEGAIVVYQQVDADHYNEASKLHTVKGARTSFFSPELRRLFLAVRREGQTPAALWVYEISK
jgi:DNA-binding beta-propeller fold protein YncE